MFVVHFLYDGYYKLHLNVYMLYTVNDLKLFNQNLVRIFVWQITCLVTRCFSLAATFARYDIHDILRVLVAGT